MAKKKTLRTAAKEVPKLSKSRSVNIEEASNGFMVSSLVDDKQIKYVAANKKEAVAYAIKIFEKF